MDIQEIVRKQKSFFKTGATRTVEFRWQMLDKLCRAMREHEAELLEALKRDLNKAEAESYMTELGLIYSEITYARKHLSKWNGVKRIHASPALMPAGCVEYSEPYGCVLIIAPWNYPLLLCLQPLIGALAAGNCAVIKPSELAPFASAALVRLIMACFLPEYVAVAEGGKETSVRLLEQDFDFIFYTGGEAVGKLVMEAASRHLTPVCLELGGKSPCIVDETANLKVAAKRIACGKIINAGQTCVAPDYLFVHRRVKDELIRNIIVYLRQFLNEPLNNKDYPSIINERHSARLMGLMEKGNIIYGGKREGRRIEPTLIENVSPEDPIMQEEIFGPLLPVFVFDGLDEVVEYVTSRPKPLALYFFSQSKPRQERIIKEISFGGGCINDTIMHVASRSVPFGGVGSSGMGRYHGRYSFDLFSHKKSVLKQKVWIDLPMRYHPYKASALNIIKKILK